MKFEVDMGEWTTPWWFNQKAYEYHEDVEHRLSSWQNKWLKLKLWLKPVSSFQNRKCYDIAGRQFQQKCSVLERWRPRAACVPTDQNIDAEWQCNKTCQHQQRWNRRLNEDTLLFQVESSATKVFSYNEITCEFTYLVTMSAKPISAATREITPFLLTVVKWVSAVCIQVRLHIMVCFGSETKYTSIKLLC
jgi:hypothetical protein